LQDTPAQRRVQHLQAQLATASAQLAEAFDTQQQYADVIQQLKQGHAEFERQLEQLTAELAGQQQHMTKVSQTSLAKLFRRQSCFLLTVKKCTVLQKAEGNQHTGASQ
jgi:chromosome segregation ATPase